MFTFVNQFFSQILEVTANLLGNNYGLAIIAVTLIIRLGLIPLTLPSLRSTQKMSSLKPELDKLKEKYGNDKKLLSQKQLELYQEHKINPLGGCLPQLVQIGLFIIFYQVLSSSLTSDTPGANLSFLWLQLNQPDSTFVLPVLAGLSQFLLGLMLAPATSTAAETKLAAQTKTKKDDKKAEDLTDMAQTLQSQMMYVMPVFTFFIARAFPSGLALYWVVSTLFSLIQQYFVSGWGGLKPHLNRFGLIVNQ